MRLPEPERKRFHFTGVDVIINWRAVLDFLRTWPREPVPPPEGLITFYVDPRHKTPLHVHKPDDENCGIALALDVGTVLVDGNKRRNRLILQNQAHLFKILLLTPDESARCVISTSESTQIKKPGPSL